MGKAMTMHDQKSDEEMKQSKTSFRITLDINISRELCHRIHIAASQNNLSLNEYIERILGEAVSREASLTQQECHPLTRKTLEHILQVHAEIMEHTGGYLFEESAELLRQEREERSRHLEEL